MFQLVAAVVSIGLVAALAVSSLHFGGQAFEQGRARAAAVEAERASLVSRDRLTETRRGYVTIGGE